MTDLEALDRWGQSRFKYLLAEMAFMLPPCTRFLSSHHDGASFATIMRAFMVQDRNRSAYVLARLCCEGLF